MTEPGSVLLDRAQIERVFTALGDLLCGEAWWPMSSSSAGSDGTGL